MRALLLAALLAGTVCASPTVGGRPRQDPAVEEEESEPAVPDGEEAFVTRGVDGDTFEARFSGEEVDVRLIGIDSPESVIPEEPVECFGPESSDFTERRLEHEEVLLEFDVQRIDPYGRTLAYVWTGKRLFNEDMVRKGFATVATYPPNVAHVERLVEAERKARRDGLGLWDACLLPVDTGADWRELGDE